jgi:predicted nucleic acid-binding protein
MKPIYILDACAMLAILYDEKGSDIVTAAYEKAVSSKMDIAINKVNLLEVYYDLIRKEGKERADDFYTKTRSLPIKIKHEITDEVFKEAGRLKATYKISLADSIALAEASVSGGELLTADHHEFDTVEKQEKIKFRWIR